MKRQELEHLIRAAGAVTNEKSLIVIGSQAILGQFKEHEIPKGALLSREADLIPVQSPELWNLIDGTLGEGSPFEEAYGYFADGVERSTAILPEGWEDRLKLLKNDNTNGYSGLCLEVHDLLISKYIAGREKDLKFCHLILDAHLASPDILYQRLQQTLIDEQLKNTVLSRIKKDSLPE